MAVPQRYLYIVDLDTGEALVVMSVDHLQDDRAIERHAAVLRRTHRIDDPGTRLALKDSRSEPLAASVLAAKVRPD